VVSRLQIIEPRSYGLCGQRRNPKSLHGSFVVGLLYYPSLYKLSFCSCITAGEECAKVTKCPSYLIAIALKVPVLSRLGTYDIGYFSSYIVDWKFLKGLLSRFQSLDIKRFRLFCNVQLFRTTYFKQAVFEVFFISCNNIVYSWTQFSTFMLYRIFKIFKSSSKC